LPAVLPNVLLVWLGWNLKDALAVNSGKLLADQRLSWWLSKMLMLWRTMLGAPVANLCGRTEQIFLFV